eukprot:scaffold686_cov437-Pavlova_lutheri.AAC.3
MGIDRMEPGASANAPPYLDQPPLKEPGLKHNDLQMLQVQAVHNRRPGKVLPFHAIDNLAPRKEFFTSQFSFGRRPAKLQRSKPSDAQSITWKTTKSVQQLSPRDSRWIDKLAYNAPFNVESCPGSQNVAADYFSRHPVDDSAKSLKKITVLDLCGGMGTTLRALKQAIPEAAELSINYIAVEQDPDCEAIVQRVFNPVHVSRPGLFIREGIFRYGSNVRTLAHRRLLPPEDLLIAGMPCLPFSRANTSDRDPPLGLRDVRELFTAVRDIRNSLVGDTPTSKSVPRSLRICRMTWSASMNGLESHKNTTWLTFLPSSALACAGQICLHPNHTNIYRQGRP